MGEKKSEIQGAKLLRKQIPHCIITPESEGVFNITDQGGNWELYTSADGTVFALWKGYFDISGWNREQLSAFIEGVGWQEAQEWAASPLHVTNTSRIRTWDMLSKAYLPDSILDNQAAAPVIGYWYPPGFSGSNYDLEEIFAGRFRTFDLSAILSGGWTQSNEQVWGCGDATAGDKLYITRIVYLSNVQNHESGSIIIIPPQDIITNAIVVDEKDLVYMERLRRSYVLGESRNP
jgi:hypothetical protein